MNEVTQKIQTGILQKPNRDTNFAIASSKILIDVVEQNGWSMALGGKKKHLLYEAWQTLGKYYGYTVKTGEANYVEYGEVKGFEAKAWVIDNKTGIEIGGAEAACLSDEGNWKNKPLFQLKSMSQTRAGAKALRQILGFVAAMANYSPTPAEEMVKEDPAQLSNLPTELMLRKTTMLVCSLCDTAISQKVSDYSISKYKIELCYDCQKKADAEVIDKNPLPAELQGENAREQGDAEAEAKAKEEQEMQDNIDEAEMRSVTGYPGQEEVGGGSPF